mgnify:FL=1
MLVAGVSVFAAAGRTPRFTRGVAQRMGWFQIDAATEVLAARAAQPRSSALDAELPFGSIALIWSGGEVTLSFVTNCAGRYSSPRFIRMMARACLWIFFQSFLVWRSRRGFSLRAA